MEEVCEESIPATDLMVGDPEVKTVKVFVTRSNDCAETLDRLSRFSFWTTLLKVIAKIKRLGSKGKSPDVVNSKERESAAKSVIKLVQQQAFSQEIKVLDAEGSLPRSNPLLSIKHSSLSEEFRHPYILPKDCQRTLLNLFRDIIILKYAIKVKAKLRWSSDQMACGLSAAASWLLN